MHRACLTWLTFHFIAFGPGGACLPHLGCSCPFAVPFVHCSGDYIRSDWEEKQAIATLQAIELVKHCCEVRRSAMLVRV